MMQGLPTKRLHKDRGCVSRHATDLKSVALLS
jgi:hypothetical protein